MTSRKHKSSERKKDTLLSDTDLNLSENEIEQQVESTAGSYAIEGMILTEEDKERCRQALRGDRSAREIADELIKEYRKNNNYSG